jgi:hypothetical protein
MFFASLPSLRLDLGKRKKKRMTNIKKKGKKDGAGKRKNASSLTPVPIVSRSPLEEYLGRCVVGSSTRFRDLSL